MADWHLITGEYPPQTGGVADYSYLVAAGLAGAGDEVHVWCPPAASPTPELPGVTVHRELGRIAPADLARVGRMLDRFPRPRRLLVQWVPHAYGYLSMNLPFCAWIWGRAAARGDRVEVMVHEPWLSFRRGAWKRSGAALVHRAMALFLIHAARRVWAAAPEWAAMWRPYALGRGVPFAWLPIPGNVPVRDDPAGVSAVRERYAPPGGVLLGHFGTYGWDVAALLRDALPPLLAAPGRAALLLGRGGEAFRDELLRRHPELAGRVHATGGMPPDRTSLHLRACDLLVQPYPDGVNARRGSIMAGLEHALPIVTTTGAVTEPLWAESGAVALAPAGDAAALAAGAERLLADPCARRRLGEAAGALYRATFDVSHTVAALRAEAA